ncbi:hypothetical protein [Metamycoplasma buccale]|uniref:hypothetical protein n=1 Tax=Metamycoplasma buccale TaxID=55602 RepID=UPI00398EF7DC
MKKKNLITFTFGLIGLVTISPVIISCVPKNRPFWDKNINEERDKSYLDGNSSTSRRDDVEISGSWESPSYNIPKEVIKKIFQNAKFSLTEVGKQMTAKEFYKYVRDQLRKFLLPTGKYNIEGKMSFEEILSRANIAKLINITWPNLKVYDKYNDKYWEIRYELVLAKESDNFVSLIARIYHSDKYHIDRRRRNSDYIFAHDTGIGVGPSFIYKITGFKE